jgi:hypothetical protein
LVGLVRRHPFLAGAVAALLVAASIPAIHDGRQARGQARSDTTSGTGGTLVADADTRFRGRDIRGRLLRGDAFPPGLTRAPRPGEVFVSPALRDVLATPDGRFQVLDEEELPPDLDPVLRRHIEACRDRIVAELPTLIAEIEARTATLLHRVAERG